MSLTPICGYINQIFILLYQKSLYEQLSTEVYAGNGIRVPYNVLMIVSCPNTNKTVSAICKRNLMLNVTKPADQFHKKITGVSKTS